MSFISLPKASCPSTVLIPRYLILMKPPILEIASSIESFAAVTSKMVTEQTVVTTPCIGYQVEMLCWILTALPAPVSAPTRHVDGIRWASFGFGVSEFEDDEGGLLSAFVYVKVFFDAGDDG